MLSEDDRLAFDDYFDDLEPDYAYLPVESCSEDPSLPVAELPPCPNVRSIFRHMFVMVRWTSAELYFGFCLASVRAASRRRVQYSRRRDSW